MKPEKHDLQCRRCRQSKRSPRANPQHGSAGQHRTQALALLCGTAGLTLSGGCAAAPKQPFDSGIFQNFLRTESRLQEEILISATSAWAVACELQARASSGFPQAGIGEITLSDYLQDLDDARADPHGDFVDGLPVAHTGARWQITHKTCVHRGGQPLSP